MAHRVDQTSNRMDQVGHRVDQTTHRVDAIVQSVDQMTCRVDAITHRMDQLAHRTPRLSRVAKSRRARNCIRKPEAGGTVLHARSTVAAAALSFTAALRE